MKKQLLQLFWFVVIGICFFLLFTFIINISIKDRLPESVNLNLVAAFTIYLVLWPAFKISSLIVFGKKADKMFQFSMQSSM